MLVSFVKIELLRSGRRGVLHVLRWCYGLWLLFVLALYFGERRLLLTFLPMPGTSLQKTASFAELFVAQFLVLTVLAAPLVAAGAIVTEKANGALYLLPTSG